jgi:hypothetical protein
MAGGVVCLIIYMLLTLSAPVSMNAGLGGILFYVAIVALPLGAVLYMFGEMKR